MLKISQMQTLKGIGVGDEAVIGELLRYKKGGNYSSAKRAKIALLKTEECNFDLLFEVSQEFLGFICIGEYDRDIADMAEELRLVGVFSEDEVALSRAVNEKTILFPEKSRVVLAPDMEALRSFEEIAFSKEDTTGRELMAKNRVKRFFAYKKSKICNDSKKSKKYFENY